jgi:hypothetical protein
MIVSERNIIELFDVLWPAMPLVQTHRASCLEHLPAINSCFKKFKDHNELLNSLRSIDNIGITIASGLIWSVYPEDRVPFDKYTLAFAIEEEILTSEHVSQDYVHCCDKIKTFCDEVKCEDPTETYTITDFVREALEVAEELEYEPLNPK